MLLSAMGVGAIRLAGMGLGLLVTIVIGRSLGPEGLGAYGYAVIVLTLLCIPVNIGWGTLLLRQVAGALQGGGWQDVKGMMRRGTQLAALVALAVLLVALGLRLSGHLGPPTDVTLLAVLVGVLFLDQLSGLRLSTLRGLNHPVWGQLPEMLVRSTVMLVSFGTLVASTGSEPAVRHAFWAMGIASLASAMTGGLLLRRIRPEPLANAAPHYDTRAWLASAGVLASNSGLLVLNPYVDVLVLGALGTLHDVGVYRIATQVSLLSGFVYAAVNMVAMPRFATLHAAGDKRALQSTAVFMARVAVLGALPLPVIFLLWGRPLLHSLFGPGFESALAPMFLLFLGQVANAAAGLSIALLTMCGHERKLFRHTAVAVMVNASVSALLIPHFGAVGAAIGNVTAGAVLILSIWGCAVRVTGVDGSILGRLGTVHPRPAIKGGSP